MAPYRKNTQESSSGQGCLLTFVPSLFAIGLGILAVIFFGNTWGTGSQSSFPAASRLAVGSNPAQLASFFSPSVLAWSGSVESWARQYGLDANLIATVMQIESCGDPQALSYAGAAGLFQVMPFHFTAGEDPKDPGTNARRGLAYLKRSLDASQGDVRKALAGYNGGIGVIDSPEMFWSDETRRYASWGSRIYAEAVQGLASSDALQEWLNSGGSNLCRQASQKALSFQP